MRSLLLIIVSSALFLLSHGCKKSVEEKYPDLSKSSGFVRYLTSKRFLMQSAFRYTNPEKKPSQFVSYLFSTIGSAEWVVTGDPFEEEQMRSISVPIPAPNVLITWQHSKTAEKQLVLTGDDDNMQIIVSAYLKENPDPVFTKTIPFNP